MPVLSATPPSMNAAGTISPCLSAAEAFAWAASASWPASAGDGVSWAPGVGGWSTDAACESTLAGGWVDGSVSGDFVAVVGCVGVA